ncbi:MAG TPA: acyltransferase [Gemmatimonadales bacterium]|nr:acyltransferase [Gemmatimonadales bacterium]
MSDNTRSVAPTGHHLPALDGLRGVAILLVFLTHAVALPLEPVTAVDAAIRSVTRLGWTGVDLFFVLSGFLITGILLDTKGQPRWWLNFAARRGLRIFPLYYGALVFLFILLPHLTHWSDPAYATLRANQAWYWTYTVNFLSAASHGSGTPLNTGHFWSLSIEEQYYLIWPLIVARCGPRVLLRVAVLSGIAGLLFRLAIVLHDPSNAVATFVLTPGRLDGLMTGGALAVLARAPDGLASLQKGAVAVLWVGCSVLGALSVWRGGLTYQDPVVAVTAYPVIALVFGSLLVVALSSAPGSVVARVLSSASLRSWGKYSYGLYLIHYPVLGALESKWQGYRHGVAALDGSPLPGVLLLAAVAAVASYALARLSYGVYESRFLDLKRYFDRRPRAAPPPPLARAPQSALSR